MRLDLFKALETIAASEDRVQQIRLGLDEATNEDLGLIRQSFVANLGAEWSMLLSDSSTPHTGGNLQRRVERFDQFLARFQDIVLQPRRSLVAQQLDEWLEAWNAGQVTFLEYLRDADDETLAEIEEILDQSEAPEFSDSTVRELARGWMAYWVTLLRMQEKHSPILVGWLRHVDQGLYSARLYAEEFVAAQVIVAIDETTQPLLRMMRERWLSERRGLLRQRNVKVDDLELDQLKEHDESEWSDFQSNCHALGLAIQDCSPLELALIEQTVTGWELMTPKAVHALVESLAAITGTKLCYTRFLEGLGTVGGEPVSEDVAELVHWRPVLPGLSDMSSVAQMSEAFRHLDENLDAWKKQFAEVVARVQKDAHRWDRAPLPEELRTKINWEDSPLDDIATLEDLVEADAEVASVNQQIHEAIEQTLSTSERELWERLNEHQQRGEASVDLLALGAQLDASELLGALWGLIGKRFIRVEVIL